MSIRKAGQVIAGTPTITTGHHVGEIFWTSRLDNELNGAVDANGATYSVEAFTGEKSVPELLRKGSLPSVSMAEYESIVSANGSCRAWGWDNGDTFRVPLLKDVYLMAGQAESAGEFISESLPNITGGVKGTNRVDTGETTNGFKDFSGAFFSTGEITHNVCTTAGGSYKTNGLGLDASRSSSAYQNGAKVRPDSVRYRAMVQLSTGVKEDASHLKEYKFNNPHFFGESKWSDIDPKNSSWLISNGNFHSGATYTDVYKQLQVELNDSLNVGDTVEIDGRTFVKRGLPVKLSTGEYDDYDFVVNTADETFRLPLLNGSEDLPSDRYENLTLQASGSPYTAPANGWYVLYKAATASGQYNESFSPSNRLRSMVHSSYSGGTSTYIFVKKGDVYEPYYSVAGVTQEFVFIYAQGNGSLYFYVGDTLQDPALINVGGVLSDVADLKQNKADVSALDAKLDREGNYTVVETYRNGSSWYRVWSDGWCEQGGYSAAGGYIVTFLKKYTSTDYTAFATFEGSYSANSIAIVTRTNTGFHLNRGTAVTDIQGKFWRAEGYIR